MRQFNILRGTKGWLYMWERTIRFRHMRNEQEVRRRVKILDFWKEHGEKATRDAFGVSRRTLYRWQAVLDRAHGKLDALDPKSTEPKNKRRRDILPGVERLIIAERGAHPRYGKKKLKVFLGEEGLLLSESYIGRVIHELKERDLLPSGRKLSYYAKSGAFREQPVFKRKKLRRAHKRGMEIDTIVRFIDGVKRYVYTAIRNADRFRQLLAQCYSEDNWNRWGRRAERTGRFKCRWRRFRKRPKNVVRNAGGHNNTGVS